MTGYTVDRDTAYVREILVDSAQPVYNTTSGLGDSRNPLAHAIFATGGTIGEIQHNFTPKAFECTISWCVKTILSEYAEEGYNENVTHVVVNDTLGKSPVNPLDAYDNYGESSRSICPAIMENIAIKGGNGHAFEVNNETHILALSMLDDILPSTHSLINDTESSNIAINFQSRVNVGQSKRNVNYNPFSYDNITDYLDTLTTEITNRIRSATSNTRMIEGLVYEKERIVGIRWQWLALPFSLLGLTFIFLVRAVSELSPPQLRGRIQNIGHRNSPLRVAR